MPSIVAHAAVALSAGSVFRDRLPPRAWIAGGCCAILPDLDSLAFSLGIPYGSPFGHRGFFHGLFFAGLLGGAAAVLFSRLAREPGRTRGLAVYLVAVAVSHGLLDTLTNGGLGVALLSPFSAGRFFAPWRPIEVSPVGLEEFLGPWGQRVLVNELLWIGLPCVALALAAAGLRSRAAGRNPAGT
jgi:inner membrane protein